MRDIVRTSATKAAARAAALAAVEKKLMESAGVIGSIDGKTLVPVACTAWLEQRRDSASPLSPTSAELYRRTVKNHLTPALGGVRVSELSTPAVEQALARLSPGTRATARKVLTGTYSWLVRMGVVAHDPVQATSPAPRSTPAPVALSDTEIAAVLAVTRARAQRGIALWLPAAVALLALTGLRPGEVAALRWEDYTPGTDSRAGVLRVARLKKRGEHVDSLSVPSSLDKVLAEHRQQQLPRSPLIFPTATDPSRPLTATDVSGTLRAAIAWARDEDKSGGIVPPEVRAALPAVVTPRSFRSTLATRLATAGGTAAASSQLGHAGEAVTLSHYIKAAHAVDHSALIEHELGALIVTKS